MSVNPSQAQGQAPTTAPAAPAVEGQAAPAAPAPAAVQEAPAVSTPDASILAERSRISQIMGVFEGLDFAADAHSFIESGKSVQEAQAHAFGKLRAQNRPAAPAVTQQQLAAEGTLAAAAAAAPAPSAPPAGTPDAQSSTLRAAMTRGVNSTRIRTRGPATK